MGIAQQHQDRFLIANTAPKTDKGVTGGVPIAPPTQQGTRALGFARAYKRRERRAGMTPRYGGSIKRAGVGSHAPWPSRADKGLVAGLPIAHPNHQRKGPQIGCAYRRLEFGRAEKTSRQVAHASHSANVKWAGWSSDRLPRRRPPRTDSAVAAGLCIAHLAQHRSAGPRIACA